MKSQTPAPQGNVLMREKPSDPSPPQARLVLAKLTPPSLPKLVQRPQLSERIDQLQQDGANVVWIQAPPGAGKTMLAASYLSAANQPALWYQLNTGDTDPATWFHYLTQGIRQAAPRFRKPMPALEPIYLADLTEFTRQFFEQLFARLKSPSILVFDNYHELPPDSPVQALMAEVIRMIPPGILCLVTSRQAPPPQLATFVAEQRLVEFPAQALAFDLAETRSLVALHRATAEDGTDEWTRQLHTQTHGWIAGIILLSTYRHSTPIDAKATSSPVMPAQIVPDDSVLMDYFAQEGLARLSDEVRSVLLKTAMLSAFTAPMAQQLTGVMRAGYELKKLARARYFVESRNQGDATVYQYHPLFRQFLCQQASIELGPTAWRDLQTQAATLLVDSGRFDEAIQLLLAAQEIQSAIDVILTQAPTMIQQGRFVAVDALLGQLPPKAVRTQPWLQYWRGMGQLFAEPETSLRCFELAHAQFDAQADATGQLLAASGAILAIDLTFTQYNRYDRWIAVIDALWEQQGDSLPADVQIPIVTAMIRALFMQLPHRQVMLTWIKRAQTLIRQTDSVEFLSQLILFLFHGDRWYGNLDQTLETTAPLVRYLNSQQLSPPNALMWALSNIWIAVLMGQDEEAQAHFERGLEIVARHRIMVLQPPLVTNGLVLAMNRLDIEAVDAILSREDLQVRQPIHSHRAVNLSARGWLHAQRGDMDTALDFAQQAVDIVEVTEGRWNGHYATLHIVWILLASARYAEAQPLLDRIDDYAGKVEHMTFLYWCHILRAYIALQSGDRDTAMTFIQKAFVNGRKFAVFHTIEPWYPQILVPVCVAALEAGIEPEYTRQLIQVKRMTRDARTANTTDWPWPIRIHTLGTFRITTEAGPLTFKRKAPLTPLRLLKLLISLGGENISLTRLSDELWPDAEGDAAYRSILTNLTRLRKLLGHEEVLIVQGGLLSLNTHLCWVDCFAFEYFATTYDAAMKADKKIEARACENQVRALFLGPFLPTDEDIPEIWRTRKRLGQRLTRLEPEIPPQES